MTNEQPIDDLISVRDIIRWGASEFMRQSVFFGHGTDNAWDEALQLVLHTLRLPIEQEPMVLDARLTRAERRQLLALFNRRITERIPVAYLTGEGWFAGLPFYVNQHVLVPRSPLAELIEAAFQPWLGSREPQRILDLCTGSGCIGIACALAFPEAEVVLSDISTEALKVAQSNIERHGLRDRVQAVHSNLFSALDGQKFDLIISNPPYVDAEDLADMPAEYHHEPRLGLAAGNDGLDLVRQILERASGHLEPDGLLVVEVGNSAVALETVYNEVPFTWVMFERGGDGVFVLSAEELCRHAEVFRQHALP